MAEPQMDFDKAAQQMIDKLPKKDKKDFNGNSSPDFMQMDKSQVSMMLSMIPKKQRIILVFVVIFVLYGLVSSILDLANLIIWLF